MKFGLPLSTITTIFKTNDERNSFDKMLKHIDEDQISIFRDPDKLEQLYIIDNYEKLNNKDFREKLLWHAIGNKFFNNFTNKIGKGIISSNMTEAQQQNFVNDVNSFEWGHNDTTRAFVNSFELDESIIPPEPTQVKNIELISMPPIPYDTEFFYQSEVKQNTKSVLSIPGGRVIIQVPTGGGKTKIAMEIVTDFFNQTNDATIVWLAESRELLEQAIKSFKSVWEHRGTKTVYLNRFWDKFDLDASLSGSKLIVSSLSKIINFYKKNENFKADFIIFDEAHHSAAEKYSDVILNLTVPGRTKVLGLTATPGRGSDDENAKLSHLFNDELPIEIDTHDSNVSPIDFLRKAGVLSKLLIGGERIVENPDLGVEFSSEELKKLVGASDYSTSDLKKIGQSYLRNTIIFDKLLELAEIEEKQILYFGPSVEQAKMMALLLQTFGIKAGFIDANTPKEYRDELIKKFQEKKINILLNYNVLTAGFDAPAINTVFIARPTKSPNTLFQMVGRGMRGPSSKDGTEFCEVFVIQDKFLERFQNFNQLYDTYHDYYVQHDVPEIDIDKKLDQLSKKKNSLDPKKDEKKIKRIDSAISKIHEKNPTMEYEK